MFSETHSWPPQQDGILSCNLSPFQHTPSVIISVLFEEKQLCTLQLLHLILLAHKLPTLHPRWTSSLSDSMLPTSLLLILCYPRLKAKLCKGLPMQQSPQLAKRSHFKLEQPGSQARLSFVPCCMLSISSTRQTLAVPIHHNMGG